MGDAMYAFGWVKVVGPFVISISREYHMAGRGRKIHVG